MAEYICSIYTDGSVVRRSERITRCYRCENMVPRGKRIVCGATGRKVHNMGYCAWAKQRGGLHSEKD